jgi:GNAT superfamily N-acetyltransferase
MHRASSEFTSPIDEYVVLKMNLADYRPTTRELPIDYEIRGSEVREKVRRQEVKLLSRNFEHWMGPYEGKLKGWRSDTPIYVLYKGNLVAGVYLCSENEFDEGTGWGQLHYAFMHPGHRGKGIYSVLFAEAIKKARKWNLEGLILNSDRHLLPQVYLRWGAVPWKEIQKSAGAKRAGFLGRMLRKISARFARRRLDDPQGGN